MLRSAPAILNLFLLNFDFQKSIRAGELITEIESDAEYSVVDVNGAHETDEPTCWLPSASANNLNSKS